MMTHDAVNKEEPYTWALAHDQLTFSQPPQLNMPQTAGSTEEQLPTTVVSYAEFLDKSCPKIEGDQEREGERAQLMAAFARPGGAGAKFKTHLDKLYKCLSLPKGAKEELGITGEETLKYDEEEEQKMSAARRERLAEDEELD
jgi:hypothetical protein